MLLAAALLLLAVAGAALLPDGPAGIGTRFAAPAALLIVEVSTALLLFDHHSRRLKRRPDGPDAPSGVARSAPRRGTAQDSYLKQRH